MIAIKDFIFISAWLFTDAASPTVSLAQFDLLLLHVNLDIQRSHREQHSYITNQNFILLCR